MPCKKPLEAFKDASGGIVFSELKRHDIRAAIDLPCGQCQWCRLERSRQWAVRCLHEIQLHEHNCFITLTYDDAHLPPAGNLVYNDFQAFMKRLRQDHARACKKQNRSAGKIRFYAAGEYGTKFDRPHFHAILFGTNFNDKILYSGKDKTALYTSKHLDALWRQGECKIGAATFESAAYIARYIMKKITGDPAEEHYKRTNPETGEISNLKPEFNKMSLRPGIGQKWQEKYERDIWPKGKIIVNGIETNVPKYYKKKHKQKGGIKRDETENLQYENEKLAMKNWQDNTPERRLVKDEVLRAKLNLNQRKL